MHPAIMVCARAAGSIMALVCTSTASAALDSARDSGKPAMAPTLVPLAIEHCIAGPPLQIDPSSSRAMLDEDDRLGAREAFLHRFPALQPGTFAPSQIMLWRNAEGEWVYVALASNPQVPGTVCFTATFSASEFGFTPELLRKYPVDGRNGVRQP